MSHLTTEQRFQAAFERTPGAEDTAQTAHLAACQPCRDEVAQLRALAQELQLLQRSTPSAEALARYADSFAQVETRPSATQRLLEQIRAVLRWDSRQQPALQGLRSGGTTAYRQLFGTEAFELELLVEPQPQHYRLQGELIPAGADALPAPVLVQLVDGAGREWLAETEAGGRFHFDRLPGGVYRMTVTALTADLFELEALEIG